MCSLRKIFMHTIFCVVFVRGTAEWIPYNGLWYYISDDNDKLTHAEAVEKCKSLQGRLAVHSGWQEDINKLASFTGSAKRWIYLSRVLYELDPHSGTVYNLTASNANDKYGYICDWQCKSLEVYPQALDNYIQEDEHDMIDTKYDLMQGVYDLNGFKDNLRQLYTKQPHDDSTHTRIYNKWLGNNDHMWCFNGTTKDFACKFSSHFTPYYDSYQWTDNYQHLLDYNIISDYIIINFFCRECTEYEISVRNKSNIDLLSGSFYKTQYGYEIEYINSDDDSYLEYDSDENRLCLTWKPYLEECCFDYLITPTVNFTWSVEPESSDSDIVISLSCKSTTFPEHKSTVASVESDTTMNLDSKETTTGAQFTTTNHDMTSQLNAVSEISSVLNSQTVNTVTNSLDRTTNGPRSDETRSYKKATIAIAGAIGGVVLVIIISVAIVCGRRRMKNRRKRDTELNVRRGVHKSEANIYSVENKSSFVVPDKVYKPDTGKSDPLYEEVKDPTKENLYSEAETVDLNNKHMYINSGFVPGANNSQDSSDKQTSGMKTANKLTDDEDSETEFVNNDIYDGNSGLNNRKTDAPQPIPVKSPSGSDIEMFSNSLYEASGKSIDHNNKSELVKKMNNVDEDIEMYDNDLYGS